MLAALERSLLSLLHLPPEPAAPAGSPDSVRLFQPGPGYLRYQLLRWGLTQAGTAAGLLYGFAALDIGPQVSFPLEGLVTRWAPWSGFELLELVGLGLFLLQLPLTLAGVFLDFRHRWYIVTDRSLRIREGIGRVEERTMSFANLQNLSIEQGPLQRLLGIADLEVRSAGGGEAKGKGKGQGGKGPRLHVASFRGIDRAEEVKALVLRRRHDLAAAEREDEPVRDEPATGGRAAGEDTGGRGNETTFPSPPPPELDPLDAARGLLAEARRLHTVVERP